MTGDGGDATNSLLSSCVRVLSRTVDVDDDADDDGAIDDDTDGAALSVDDTHWAAQLHSVPQPQENAPSPSAFRTGVVLATGVEAEEKTMLVRDGAGDNGDDDDAGDSGDDDNANAGDRAVGC